MKRVGNLFQTISSMDNLRAAHLNARKGKGWYKDVRTVNEHEEDYLNQLHEMLVHKTYHTSEYTTFTRKDGQKERVIYKLPYFPDRICQWAIIQVIEPFLIKNLISNTYSAIPGRGIHKAMKDVQKAIRTDPTGMAYCLKLDVKKYYPSIDHAILNSGACSKTRICFGCWMKSLTAHPETPAFPLGTMFPNTPGISTFPNLTTGSKSKSTSSIISAIWMIFVFSQNPRKNCTGYGKKWMNISG